VSTSCLPTVTVMISFRMSLARQWATNATAPCDSALVFLTVSVMSFISATDRKGGAAGRINKSYILLHTFINQRRCGHKAVYLYH
jgi:hypothetical protein